MLICGDRTETIISKPAPLCLVTFGIVVMFRGSVDQTDTFLRSSGAARAD